jgi:hypothetical protein
LVAGVVFVGEDFAGGVGEGLWEAVGGVAVLGFKGLVEGLEELAFFEELVGGIVGVGDGGVIVGAGEEAS